MPRVLAASTGLCPTVRSPAKGHTQRNQRAASASWSNRDRGRARRTRRTRRTKGSPACKQGLLVIALHCSHPHPHPRDGALRFANSPQLRTKEYILPVIYVI